MVKVSIIIPAYNEEKRLKKSLFIITDYMKGIGISDYEIIVIDDGSTDETRCVANYFGAKINLPRGNRGKGYSLKQGVRLATGDYILITDSDLSTPINYFDEFIRFIPQYDIVIASRNIKGSQVKTKWYRKIAGRISNLVISLLVKDIKDSQCGFKLFEKDVAKELFSKSIIDRWGIDFEILYLAQKYGYRIKEYPVQWEHMEGSKVKFSDYPKTLLDVYKIWRCKYG
jgi:dolichyl-phosphate beta-glucosyltransferase